MSPTAATATATGYLAALFADAPTGDPCPACRGLHDSRSAEETCMWEEMISEFDAECDLDYPVELLGDADHRSPLHAARIRLAAAYHDGRADAAHVCAELRAAIGAGQGVTPC